ncbi:hypothetical protein DRW07_16295 [Alteromonas sediminis]|uniref:Uncharacterized protein n=1 Tax=Alteromonas sediminis TaxID=2259342 RepID=A0A3N5XWZ1_9ALTE|nr:hypothetical protein [Alteromonas sediminis]RPJ65457.1 hypothetical protein DRW07_16295 [Alteromonas sediminis]
MARFSQRAINNMVIFAMLIMIALFNFDSLLPRPSTPPMLSLIPADAHILKIDFPTYSIERVASTFVYKNGDKQNVAPEKRAAAWQIAEVQPSTTNNVVSALPYIVTVWLAGQPQGHVFAFYRLASGEVIVEYQKAWYSIDSNTAQLLVGEME